MTHDRGSASRACKNGELNTGASVATAVRCVLRQRRIEMMVLSAATLAMAMPNAFAQSTADTTATAETPSLTEIVVTAQRRTQTVQDIPYNISVVGGEDITKSGAVNINDLSRIVNGLITVDQGPGARSFQNDLTLRGLRTDAPGGGSSAQYLPTETVNPVSTYFGETPIFFPMVLEDIERVEVLRGPQGTLYGSGAEAGTIRVIPHAPDMTSFAAEVSATGSYTEFSNHPNDNIHGMVNIPLSDTLAIRLVAGQEHLGGFINAVDLWKRDANGVPLPSVPGNLNSGAVIGPEEKGVNSSNQGFERLALRWKPTDTVDVQFDYLHQTTTQADPQVSTPFWPGGCVDLPNGTVSPSKSCAGAPASTFYANAGGPYTTAAFTKEPYRDTVDLGSIVANIDFGFANLTSSTSYDRDRNYSDTNVIASAVNLGAGNSYEAYPPYNGYPRINFIAQVPATDKSFVQELRLTSKGKNLFDYVVGAFYQRETRVARFQVLDYGQGAYNASVGQPDEGDVESTGSANTVYSDKALFGELTAHITDAWQVTGGLRFFRDAFSVVNVDSLPLCGAACSQDLTDPSGLTIVRNGQNVSGHLKKLNTSYDLSANTKVYVTYSEGFRRGGTNGLPINGPFAALPEYQTFTPDYAKNYEVGLKGALFDKRVRYSGALYRVDLDNFQFNSYSEAGAYAAVFNGNAARTQGIEFEFQAAATENLTFSAGYTYTQAKTAAAVNKSDLVAFALIPADGGTGLTDTAPFINIAKGVRLPGVPLNTATFGADYNVPKALLGNLGWTLLLHADAAYRSSAPGNIDDTRVFYWKVPSSLISNARASLGLNEHLGFDLFVNNLTSNTGYSGASYVQTVTNPYQLRNVTRPRTVGLTLRYKF
jgi:iron complex outermembrane recepter protein